MKKTWIMFILLLLVTSVLFSSCAVPEPVEATEMVVLEETATLAPTATEAPTNTPAPTETPVPTDIEIPIPTPTIVFTETSIPETNWTYDQYIDFFSGAAWVYLDNYVEYEGIPSYPYTWETYTRDLHVAWVGETSKLGIPPSKWCEWLLWEYTQGAGWPDFTRDEAWSHLKIYFGDPEGFVFCSQFEGEPPE